MSIKLIAQRAPFFIVITYITFASLMPMPEFIGPTIWDKALHFVGYAGLCFLGYIAFPNFGWKMAAFVVLWGIGIELAQIPVPGRLFEWGDVLANSLGALAGWASFVAMCKIYLRFWPQKA